MAGKAGDQKLEVAWDQKLEVGKAWEQGWSMQTSTLWDSICLPDVT